MGGWEREGEGGRQTDRLRKVVSVSRERKDRQTDEQTERGRDRQTAWNRQTNRREQRDRGGEQRKTHSMCVCGGGGVGCGCGCA